jgi:hypothetical protein
MRFEYYHPDLDSVPKLSVDGTVDNAVHFSHWQGNETPAELKADTSTEIALNLVSSKNRDVLTQGIELVVNNHFDTDGVLSVWTVLNGERALDLRGKLIPAAESGDFSEYTNEAAIRVSIAIQGSEQPGLEDKPGSPLACQLAGRLVDENEAYDFVLPEVERLLMNIDDYAHLWRTGWEKIASAVESFERGKSTVTELDEGRLSLVSLATDVFGQTGVSPIRHSTPFTAISRYAKGRLFLIATPLDQGWAYRIDYPYYSWAETVVRPLIPRRDFSGALIELNQKENSKGRWKTDTSELTSAVKFVGDDGKLAASTLKPNEVAQVILAMAGAEVSAAARCS